MLDAYNARTTGPKVNYNGRILISDRAQVLFDFHKIIDGKKEEVDHRFFEINLTLTLDPNPTSNPNPFPYPKRNPKP